MKRIILLSLIFVSFIATSAPAAIRVVSPDDYTTIQAAIDDANDGDTVMITPGTYTGPGNRDIDFRGKAITVRSVAPENPHIVAATVIDCNGSETEPNRGFYFHSYEDGNSVLEGLTITNGYAEQGGAIYCYSSDPTIANCSFTANTAISGGGLYCRGSSPVVTNCTFSQNLADGSGGGLYCEENRYLGPGMLIANCTFNQNLADMGGGLYCGDKYPAGSSPTITNCTFADNSADNGGGVYCGGEHTGSNPTITNCTFNENAAYHSGGGMYCSAPSSPTIRYCTFTGNSACGQAIDYYYRYGGGAVYGCRGEIRHCTITYNRTKANGGGLHRCSRVVNSLISGNTAGQDGGGTYGCNQIANCVVTGNSATWRGGGTLMGYYDIWIWLADYAPPEYFGAVEQAAIYGYYDYDYEIITNCTITANRAGFEEGGGVFCYYGSFPLTNSILWANAAASGTGESAQIGGATPDVTFSCIQDDDPDDDYIPFGGEENGNIDDNPMFVRSADDGADGWGDDPCTPDVNEAANDDFGDLHLTLTSPCINTGDPGYTAAWNHVDMDGQPRVIGGRVDMGADEYALIILVTRPEPGEVWVSGSKHEVKWESHGAAGTVDILLSTNSGSDWTKIEDNIANTGSYFWHLPEEVDSNQCVISVVPGSPNPDVICIDSGVFTIHPDTPGPVVPSRWPSLGGDFDRAGLSANYGPELGCVKWQFKTEGAVSASPTIGAEDRVHIACEDGKLYTLDANGALLWSCDTNSPLISAPTVGPDGSVYVGSESGKLYVIDINGNVRWTHRADGFIYSSPAVSPETNDVYVCSSDGTLYALAQDGSELWSFQTGRAGVIGSAIFASPALGSDGTVYVGGFNDANLYALDPDDGSVRWVRSAGRNNIPDPAVRPQPLRHRP
ncbi:MAG: outer membrane protein assembly factor BamB family protein [Planctomycetota bacterium]|jgi:predicted outer membrane repeat protein